MKKKILIAQDITKPGKDAMEAYGYEIKYGSGADAPSLIRDIADCEAAVIRTAPYTAEVLDAAKNLKVLSRCGIGVDNVDFAAADRLGIWVTNAPTCNLATVAEATIGLLVSAGRRLSFLEREFRRGNFEIRNTCLGNEVQGKTLSVVGLGRIGKTVCTKAMLGLGMRVVGYDPYVKKEDLPEGVELLDSWDAAFSRADFVSLHMPYNGKPLVGEHELSLMKPTAFLLNLARGKVVDEKALIRVLKGNRIAGAALDVFEDEPPKPDNPLLSMENVILTPHVTGLSHESFERAGLQNAESIHQALNGKKPDCACNNPPNPRNM